MPVQSRLKTQPARRHYVLLAVLCGAAWLLFVHPDIVETTNHSYLFLESLFSGRFFSFYENILARQGAQFYLYYVNGAHYNIVVYMLFALVELPIFLFNQIFHLPPNGDMLVFVGKLVSIGFYLGCMPLVQRLAQQLKLGETAARWAALFYALWPPAFFSAAVVGQYDSICLFFILLGLLAYNEKRMLAFSFWFGLAAVFKFFSLILLVPLLLAAVKKPLRILKYAVCSLWLVLPTMLLFAGRSGEANLFNAQIVQRLLGAELPGARMTPVFVVLYIGLCLLAYLWRPAREDQNRAALWLCLATFGLLFVLVPWHPQWFILLASFVVLSTALERQKVAFSIVDILLSLGLFVSSVFHFSRHFEDNLFDLGILGHLSGLSTSGMVPYRNLTALYQYIPQAAHLAAALLTAALLAHLVLKIPLRGGTPASRLGNATGTALPGRWLWLVFGIGSACWFVPALVSWLLRYFVGG